MKYEVEEYEKWSECLFPPWFKIFTSFNMEKSNFCGYYDLQGTILEEIFFEISYNVILFWILLTRQETTKHKIEESIGDDKGVLFSLLGLCTARDLFIVVLRLLSSKVSKIFRTFEMQ